MDERSLATGSAAGWPSTPNLNLPEATIWQRPYKFHINANNKNLQESMFWQVEEGPKVS